MIDPWRLHRPFGNLVDNAQRYSPPEKPVTIAVTDSKGGILTGVRDEGPGIAEARRNKIFDRFYTTDAEKGGTGLGLAIVDSVARAHGGEVTFESEVGKGSSFQLWLPGVASDRRRP